MKPNENHKHVGCRKCSAALRKRKLGYKSSEGLHVLDVSSDDVVVVVSHIMERDPSGPACALILLLTLV